jgi:hypothetical protein
MKEVIVGEDVHQERLFEVFLGKGDSSSDAAADDNA